MLNPDIYYDEGVLENIIDFMVRDKSIGLIMPKILYPNGNVQYLAKLIPSPIDFFIRRFMPVQSIKEKITNNFELKFSGYNQIMEVPYLSGCFMVFSSEALKKIQGFDEKIFMHMEDLDISRRCIAAGFKNVFYPNSVVFHDHLFKSISDWRNLKMYLTSAVYYFNKWGWIFDKERSITNKRTISKIKEQK
ncbi:N-acetylglucosaminyl-diphospho-decaprenol L-rhamnosyltransferase [compost metagenome]